MPLIVFECKGIPATRRERVEGAVEAGGRHAAADPFRGGVRGYAPGLHDPLSRLSTRLMPLKCLPQAVNAETLSHLRRYIQSAIQKRSRTIDGGHHGQ